MERDEEKGKDHSIIAAAFIFLLIGTTFAVIIIKQIILGKFAFPFYLVVIGTYFFAASLETEGDIGERVASLGWTLNMLGFTLFYQYGTGNWESWIYMWPLVFPVGIGLGKLGYGAVKAKREPFERGKILIEIGIGLFILILALFKLFLNKLT